MFSPKILEIVEVFIGWLDEKKLCNGCKFSSLEMQSLQERLEVLQMVKNYVEYYFCLNKYCFKENANYEAIMYNSAS